MRLAFQELYAQPANNAEAFLKKWYWWATHSRLPPMIATARMVKRHWSGILRWFSSKPPKPRLAATAPPATSRRLSI